MLTTIHISQIIVIAVIAANLLLTPVDYLRKPESILLTVALFSATLSFFLSVRVFYLRAKSSNDASFKVGTTPTNVSYGPEFHLSIADISRELKNSQKVYVDISNLAINEDMVQELDRIIHALLNEKISVDRIRRFPNKMVAGLHVSRIGEK
jgi:hypothetical protein